MIPILYAVPVSYFIMLLSFSDSDERLELNRLHDRPSPVHPILFNYIFVLFTLQSVCQGWLSQTDLLTACILIINQSQTTTTVFLVLSLNICSSELNNLKKEVSKSGEKLLWRVYVGGGGGGW